MVPGGGSYEGVMRGNEHRTKDMSVSENLNER